MKPSGPPVTLQWRLKGELVIRKVVFLFDLCFMIQKVTVSAVKGWNRGQSITPINTVALDWKEQWAFGEISSSQIVWTWTQSNKNTFFWDSIKIQQMSYIPPAGSSPGRSPRMQVPRSPRHAPPRPDKQPNLSAGKYTRKTHHNNTS